jgi:hypothetical protein
METFKYFKVNSSTTADELTLQRNELAKQNHPDKGGNTESMQHINNEFQIALAMIPKFQALGKIDSSGKQFLNDLIDGIAHLLEENKKFPKWSINIGVEMARSIVKSIDADSWATFLIGVINKHKK